MAKKKLFGNKPESSCATCSLGKTSAEGDAVMCKHAGVVSPDHSCRRFRYDPLKRIPRRSRPIESFDEQAFSLDIDETPTAQAGAPADTQSNDVVIDAQADTVDSAQNGDALIPDDTDDIFGDLARLNIEQIQSSTHAALRTFEPHFLNNDDDDETAVVDAESDDMTLLTLADDSDDDSDDTLSADDLIILNHSELDDTDDTEMLVMSESGNIESIPAE